MGYTLAAIRVLAIRDLRRFFRQCSRVIGALLQPLIFWVVIGNGMAGSFRMHGADKLGYLEYFFPGIVLMVVLFTAIFATSSLIEDRAKGFMQAVLAGPSHPAGIAFGKVLGGTAVGMLQAGVFVAMAPLAGFRYGQIQWAPLAAMLLLTSLALNCLGFAMAWAINQLQGYLAVMNVVLLPLWILSGAMFPAPSAGVMATLVKWNPLGFALSAIRLSFYGQNAPAAIAAQAPPLSHAFGITVAFLVITAALAIGSMSISRKTA